MFVKYKNVFLIGTSHIAKQSVDEVKDFIAKQKPDIVAVELDRSRLVGLSSGRRSGFSFKDVRRVGFGGFLFSLFGAWVERKLGEKVGVSPGSEMLAAVKLAQQSGVRVALIDQDIGITLKRFSEVFGWREKWNLVVDVLKGVVFRKSVFSFDLEKVPSAAVVSKLIKEVKVRYPNLYLVLVEERNVVMARRIVDIVREFPEKRILVVVGAGHEADLLLLVKRYLKQSEVV